MEGEPRPEATRVRHKPLLLLALPALSGILAWTSFPRMNQGYLAWVALVPLLLFVARQKKSHYAFLGGMITGLLLFFGLLIWIPRVLTVYGGMPAPVAWALYLLLVTVLGCFPAAACALTRYSMNRCGPSYLLVFPSAWVTLESVRSLVPFGGFPWLLFGYSQTDYLNLIQVADIVGVYGISLLIVWVNTALAWIILGRWHRRQRFTPVLAGVASVALCLVYGTIALRRWDQIKPQYNTALLQGNLSVDVPESALRSKYQQGYVKMVESLRSAHIDLLVLPESPSPLYYQYDQSYRETMNGLARRFPMGMVFNNIYFRDVDGTLRYFNSAFFLDQDGTEVGRYDKNHLVPFGEYIPWQKLFFFSETISKDIGSFYPGTERNTVLLGGHPLNVLICFEAVFPDLARDFIHRGSQLIINLTNDGWYGDTAAPYQHLAMARWRAIECRRYLLRAANSGISAIVAPSGRVEVQTGLYREDVAVGRFSFLSHVTIYVRHGDALPILCAIICFLALLRALLRGARSSGIPIH